MRRKTPSSSKTLVAVVCGGLVLAAWWVYPVMQMHYHEQQQLASLQAEYASAKSRNAMLRKDVRRLKTPAGIEQIARETLGLVHPGEKAYVVIAPKAGAPTSTPSPAHARGATTYSDPVRSLLDALFGSGK